MELAERLQAQELESKEKELSERRMKFCKLAIQTLTSHSLLNQSYIDEWTDLLCDQLREALQLEIKIARERQYGRAN